MFVLLRDRKLTDGVAATDENAKMTDCYFEKKDWRACTAEVRPVTHMLMLPQCGLAL